MKIAIVGPAYPFRGGIADTNEAMARALQKEGHQVTIFTFTLQYPSFLFPGKTQLSEEAPPEDLQIKPCIHSLNPINWFTSARKINRYKPDLVVFRYWLPFMAPCLGTIARNLSEGIKKVALTDNIVPHEKRLGDRALTRYFVKPFDGFITFSNQVTEELRVFTNAPVLFHPHPMNDQLGAKLPKAEARAALQLEPQTPYVLFFGLIRRYKGLDLLIKAFGQASLKNSNIKLLVAGEFYESNERYKKLIEELALESVVELHEGYVHMSQISTYFSAVDLVAQPYLTASQSGVTPIAYWFETPMLVTNVGGLSELVPHDKVGMVVEKDPEAIAQSISDYFEEQKEATYANHIAIEKQVLSWEHFVGDLTHFYHSL